MHRMCASQILTKTLLFTFTTDMATEFEMIAKTFQGLEEVLAEELTELGANNIQIGRRMVSFTGDKEMLYRANFCLRTATRILKPIAHFKANNPDDVYEAVKGIRWEDYLTLQTTFSVDTVVYSEEFRHSKFVAYKVKDAIVDYFREKQGDRPNISITQPDIRLNMHIAGYECTLSLDSSGDSLHLRGYRVASCTAPINEVLAAGLIKLTGWKADCDLIDPFCGSGTIAIEAALIARNIWPGIFRKSYAFEKWRDFDAELFENIYNDDSQERTFGYKIIASDINLPTLEGAKRNAQSAGVSDVIEFRHLDFHQFKQPESPAIIVTNPPYGERLTPPNILELYQTIGERLKHEFKGGDAWIICSKEECFDNVGLRPSLKLQLYNGSLDCEFRKYQVFDGSMTKFRLEGGDIKSSDDRKRMDVKKRSRLNREGFAKERRTEPLTEEERQYEILKLKHEEFERNRIGKERAEARRQDRERREQLRRDSDFDRPRRSFGRGRDGSARGREGFGRGRDGFQRGRSGGGFKGRDRQGGRGSFGRKDREK